MIKILAEFLFAGFLGLMFMLFGFFLMWVASNIWKEQDRVDNLNLEGVFGKLISVVIFLMGIFAVSSGFLCFGVALPW